MFKDTDQELVKIKDIFTDVFYWDLLNYLVNLVCSFIREHTRQGTTKCSPSRCLNDTIKNCYAVYASKASGRCQVAYFLDKGTFQATSSFCLNSLLGAFHGPATTKFGFLPYLTWEEIFSNSLLIREYDVKERKSYIWITLVNMTVQYDCFSTSKLSRMRMYIFSYTLNMWTTIAAKSISE